MLATPLLMTLAPHLAKRLPGRLDSGLSREQVETGSRRIASVRDHTIIVGFGLNGRYLARVLKDSSIPYCILELNPHTVRDAGQEGEPICFGDASRLEILRMVNLSESRILVITADDLATSRRIVSIARQNQTELYIIVRTKFASNARDFYHLGANHVIAEEFETATEIFAHVLAEYDLPRQLIDRHIAAMRRHGAPMLRKPEFAPTSLQRLRQVLAGNLVENFLLLDKSPAIGKSLAQLDLRNRTGATIIAVVRNDQSHSNPSADFVLAADDLVVAMGTHRELENVANLLVASEQDKAA
jgi:CPA2 family monovalent cation:H+ antiporter-2